MKKIEDFLLERFLEFEIMEKAMGLAILALLLAIVGVLKILLIDLPIALHRYLKAT